MMTKHAGNKFAAALLAAVMVIASLAGCGASGSKATSGASSAAQSTSAASTSSEASKSEASEASTASVSAAAVSESSASTTAADKKTVRISAMAGPTGMGMVELLERNKEGSLDYNADFTLLSAVDEIAPLVIKGDVDIACVPANLASVLYNKTEGGVETLAINTLGVLYIVEQGENVSSVADLKGKTIYASGKGATPEYALRYILTENGIDPDSDVTIEWKSEHAECLSAIVEDASAVAMLPQPFVTTAMMKNESIRIALDLTAEWDKVQEGKDEKSSMLTGVVIARKAFAEENPELIKSFMMDYSETVEWVGTHAEEAAKLIGSYEIVPEAVALKALPFCNIVCIEGSEMKEKLSGYLNVLYSFSPEAVGGTLPGDDFYYVAEQ